MKSKFACTELAFVQDEVDKLLERYSVSEEDIKDFIIDIIGEIKILSGFAQLEGVKRHLDCALVEIKGQIETRHTH